MQQLGIIEIVNSLDGLPEIDWGVKTINAHKVWDKTMGEGVKVAVIDTGVDMTHPDLNIKASVNMHTRTTNVTDEFGHGTHVAGLIAGKNTGVAPKSDLYIAKVLDGEGRGSMANVLDGITFAINYKVDILCMSLGTPRELPLILKDRIEQAYREGITIVCATGNSNVNSVEYPAVYDNVIAVGGINKDLERASFSNYGDGTDLLAPSVEILSTFKDNNYARMGGTSMASPLVAGGIALIISHYRNQGIELSPSDIRDILLQLGKRTRDFGYGILDLGKILG